MKTLSYILTFASEPFTLDLYEAERYEPAVVVQQLIGNLVYHSNHGVYEPRISESWERVSPTQWDFKIRKGFVCENGEKITATSFKESLIRSFKVGAKNGEVPVFNKLLGFNDLVTNKSNHFPGITATEDILSFHFSEPTRSGLLQLLSFAPFGYISKDNLNDDLLWKDELKFISSGPYKIEKFEIGLEYVLVKRKEWPDFSINSPDKVVITHDIPKKETDVSANTIIDSRLPHESLPKNLKNYPLINEYLCAISLGNITSGFFSSLENRRAFDYAIQKEKEKADSSFSDYFYPSENKKRPNAPSAKINIPTEPLLIEGKNPPEGTSRHTAFKLMLAAFDSLNWKYKLSNNDWSWTEISNLNYDIRIKSPSIGSIAEAWGIDILFFSQIGSKPPDPSGRVKKILVEYQNDQLSDSEFAEQFSSIVEEDAAILPIRHSGLNWYIASGIDLNSISPRLNVIRLDQLEIE